MNPAFIGSTVSHPPTSGGGGGSGFTLVASVGTAGGASGDTTSASLDSTGANLLVAVAVGQGVSHPAIIDSKSNSGWTANVDWNSSRISIFSCVPTTVGSGHTVTIQTAGACNVFFFAFTKVGGAAAFDAASAGGASGNWSSSTVAAGSITPASANDLFVCANAFDVGTGAGDTINSSFTKVNSPLLNPANLGGNVGYKIKTSDSAAENPGWARGTPNNSDCWVIQAAWK